MKKWMVFGLLVVCSVFTLAGKDRKAARGPGHFTYSFVENKGQWENRIRYKTTLPYGNLFVEDNCLTFFFLDEKAVNRLLGYKYLDSIKKQQLGIPDPDIPAHAYRVRFEGADPHPEMTSSDRYPDYKNFYLGNDPSHWASKVYQYREVVYHSLYKGIDLQLAQQEQRLKYNFHIAAGADPGSIQLRYEGAGKVRLRKGKIMIETSVANIEELAPVAWQEAADGSRIPVECGYKLQNNTISFSFPKGYDKSKKMVVDPILVFSSYSGSPVDNWGYTATYDNDGYLYAGGSVRDPGYPVTTGAFMMNYGGGISDIAISKYDTTGSFLIFSTYLGGSGTEVPNSLVVNNNNELYVLGCSGSSNYPTTPQAYSTVFKGGTAYTLTVILHYNYGSDIVISRFSQDGTSLLASTYFGGTGNDGLNSFPPLKHNYADDARGEIKIDENQNVYVVSSTQSVDLPVTQGAYQTTFGGVQDACVFKLDASLTYLLWSSYLGGNTADAGYSICFDKSGKFYVAGGTTSLNFPVTLNAYQTVYQDGGSDGFISCFNESGSSLAYSTYYGSTGYDQVYFIDQDKQGYVYALGQTSASGMTYIFNVSWSTPGGGQFITKFLPNLSARVYSTAFGTGNGGPDISPTAFMVDYCNHIYLSGWGSPGLNYFGGTSGLPVTGNAFQTTTDNNDYYFMVMNGDASGLIYATFFGDSDPAAAEHVDGGTSRFDKKGRIYQSVCAGCGGHDGFPTTTGAWSSINGSTNCNNAVIKFDFKIPLSVADFIHPLSGCAPYQVTFQNTSLTPNPVTANYHWDFGDGNISLLANPSHTYDNPGTFQIRLIVSDTGSCNQNDTVYRTLVVLGNPTADLPGQAICIGQSIQIGTTAIPDPSLSYNWFPAIYLNNSHIPNPIATPSSTTDYYLLITNGSCADTIRQRVKVYDLSVDAGTDTIVCVVSVNLTATANEDSLMFQWSSNPQFTDTLNLSLTDRTVTVNVLNQTQWFYVRSFNNLCSAIDSVSVSFAIPITPGEGQNPTCPDSCNGTAVVEINGGTPPYQYLWNTGQTTDSVSHLCAGIYMVTVTDAVACVSVATIMLSDPPRVVVIPASTNIPCQEVCNGQIDLSVSGGNSPYFYAWSNGQTTATIGNLCQGTYQVTVTDNHGCKKTSLSEIQVNSIFIDVHLTSSMDTVYQGQPSQLEATLIPGCTYSWTPADGLDNPASPNPLATPYVTTIYHVLITDAFGCVYSDSVKIIVKEVICRDPYIYVPNAFTPNHDGKNDVVFIQGNMIESMKFSVYDRWGNKVFETRNQLDGWDGICKKGNCESGVYVFYLEATCYNKEVFKKKGNITLLR